MTQKELKDLIKFCKKEGVLYYKSAEVEFSLGPKSKIKDLLKTQDDKIEQDKPPSEEEVLFWSAGINA